MSRFPSRYDPCVLQRFLYHVYNQNHEACHAYYCCNGFSCRSRGSVRSPPVYTEIRGPISRNLVFWLRLIFSSPCFPLLSGELHSFSAREAGLQRSQTTPIPTHFQKSAKKRRPSLFVAGIHSIFQLHIRARCPAPGESRECLYGNTSDSGWQRPFRLST